MNERQLYEGENDDKFHLYAHKGLFQNYYIIN